MLKSVSVSMGLLLLGIYIGRRSVKERDIRKRVLVPDERRKKRTKVDIVDERRVDDSTNDNYLGDLVISGRSITAGLVGIARRIIRRGVMSISIGDSRKTVKILSIGNFLEEFNKNSIHDKHTSNESFAKE